MGVTAWSSLGKLVRHLHSSSVCISVSMFSRGTPNCQPAETAGSSQDDEQPGPSRRKRQLSMSETMPLYTLCKEDLESMDKEVLGPDKVENS